MVIHNGCPTLFIDKITGTLALNPRIENDQLVVKDHGKPDFVDPSRMRSRRRHRFLGTEPISTEAFLSKKQEGDVMATSDIGLLNVNS